MRLAYDGIVDFSQVDFRSQAWSIKVSWFLRERQRQDMLDVLRCDSQRHLAYMAGGLLPDSWESHRKKEQKSHEEWTRLWFDLGQAEEQQAELEDALRTGWGIHFGDPDDPETQRKIDETAAALRQRRQTEVSDARDGSNAV